MLSLLGGEARKVDLKDAFRALIILTFLLLVFLHWLLDRNMCVAGLAHVGAVVAQEDNLVLKLRLHLGVGAALAKARDQRAVHGGQQLLQEDCAADIV